MALSKFRCLFFKYVQMVLSYDSEITNCLGEKCSTLHLRTGHFAVEHRWCYKAPIIMREPVVVISSSTFVVWQWCGYGSQDAVGGSEERMRCYPWKHESQFPVLYLITITCSICCFVLCHPWLLQAVTPCICHGPFLNVIFARDKKMSCSLLLVA